MILIKEVRKMCSTSISFAAMPEDVENLKRNSGIYYCRSCMKAFIKKNATECLLCGSTDIKPRMN
jgi:rRNA maturation endonuclease Nob1